MQVLTHGTKPAAATEEPRKEMTMKGRPDVLTGRTIKVESPHGTVYTTVNENGSGEAFEIFVNVGKAGSDVAADAEALGRSLSLMLRMPSPLTADQRVDLIVRHLQGIGGSRDVGFGQKRVRSVPDAIARALHTYLESKSEMPQQVKEARPVLALTPGEGIATGNLCIECGSPTVKQEGCEKCHACGWSNC
jgi:ribonucleoside-diphosphate reductase alpha chain